MFHFRNNAVSLWIYMHFAINTRCCFSEAYYEEFYLSVLTSDDKMEHRIDDMIQGSSDQSLKKIVLVK